MYTLSTNSIKEAIHSWPPMRDAVSRLTDTSCRFPFSVRGLHGSLSAYFIAEYCERIKSLAFKESVSGGVSFDSRSSDIVIVTPGENEAIDIRTDLTSIFPEAEIIDIPWWGMIPYRPVSRGAAVFGERAAALAKLAGAGREGFSQKPRIFIVSERVFLSPLPPPESVKRRVFSLFRGLRIDTIKTAERLSSLGYTRAPRVYVQGEFSLRGEVLDVFVPGSSAPCRIIFDFDTVAQIKTFDTDTQTTTGSLESVFISPMREVIWDDALLTDLKNAIEAYEATAVSAETEMELSDAASQNGETSSSDEDRHSDTADDTSAGETPSSDEDEFSDAGAPDDKEPPLRKSCRAHLPFTKEAKTVLSNMLSDLETAKSCEGEELLYPVLWKKRSTISDYIGERTAVFFFDYDRLVNAEETIVREYGGMYRKARLSFPAFPPEQMLSDFQKNLKTISRSILFHTVSRADTASTDESPSDIAFPCEVSRSFFGNIPFLKEEIEKLQYAGWKIAVFADGENQERRIAQLLSDFTEERGNEIALNGRDAKIHESDAKPHEERTHEHRTLERYSVPIEKRYALAVFPEAISEGFSIPDIKLIVIQENEIFGRRRAVPKSLKKAKSAAIDTFVELTPGDYVVHVQYGIGIFCGIERVKAGGNERDYIKLEYADKEVAFVPIEQVNMVQRYIGSEGDAPKLDKIGSKSWENRKRKVQEAVEDLAKKLIDLYSRRKASRGFPFPKDTEWQTSFEAAFPYEDTKDQAFVTEEVKRDMEKPVPMDRLICGDVGYGKTEIAMRAAFKAVMGGKQVVFLAPTTILAEQHYETCVERFANFPVKIAVLSRFVPHAEQKKTLTLLASGDIDIVIGTHRVIQKDVVFKNLGLMIIDEEQRFGVKDKEKLKEMKANIDCLALSATPIPRTLHMSLLKIRDMSLLATPPQNRQAIETAIEPYSDERVVKAIRREADRGGQVFFLHNRVDSLFEVRRKIERLVPEMLVDVAHGQMMSGELEDIFRRFKLGGFHVLVSTTIIENGIDIPNVNTIIIDRADMYGVSQLYQLRGRVGRSDRKAYAYLLYPENTSLSEVAMKRLQVISDFTELGSGFKIAMKDMEIRGAGNLLGRDQSGDVYAVGFELYLKLLNEAVERLTASENYKAQSEVLMELEYTGFIPDAYVRSAETKMEIYKKIASVQTDDELIAVMNEIEDRFGPVPDEVASLLSLAEIRILCKKLSVSALKESKGVVEIEFAKVSDISVDRVLQLIKESSGSVWLDAAKPNMLFLKLGKIGLKEKSEFIRERLEKLA
ncbi:transcription-repair coupling factor [Treponema socranskii]|uniref:transcription-repair coupling factor n=1 Tax=Treponema socranskii TaxID=53419 RepID=UPI003D949AA9